MNKIDMNIVTIFSSCNIIKKIKTKKKKTFSHQIRAYKIYTIKIM